MNTWNYEDYETLTENSSDGERYFAYGFDLVGAFGGNGWHYFWSDNLAQATERLRSLFPERKITIRSAVNGEWDCDSFNFGGHYKHE